jgi:hypothetical protein
LRSIYYSGFGHLYQIETLSYPRSASTEQFCWSYLFPGINFGKAQSDFINWFQEQNNNNKNKKPLIMIRNVALLALLLADVSAKKDGPFATYTAEITLIPGSLSTIGATATVVVFAGDDKGLIGYGGFAEGLEPGLAAAEDVSHHIHRAGVSFVKL